MYTKLIFFALVGATFVATTTPVSTEGNPSEKIVELFVDMIGPADFREISKYVRTESKIKNLNRKIFKSDVINLDALINVEFDVYVNSLEKIAALKFSGMSGLVGNNSRVRDGDSGDSMTDRIKMFREESKQIMSTFEKIIIERQIIYEQNDFPDLYRAANERARDAYNEHEDHNSLWLASKYTNASIAEKQKVFVIMAKNNKLFTDTLKQIIDDLQQNIIERRLEVCQKNISDIKAELDKSYKMETKQENGLRNASSVEVELDWKLVANLSSNFSQKVEKMRSKLDQKIFAELFAQAEKYFALYENLLRVHTSKWHIMLQLLSNTQLIQPMIAKFKKARERIISLSDEISNQIMNYHENKINGMKPKFYQETMENLLIICQKDLSQSMAELNKSKDILQTLKKFPKRNSKLIVEQIKICEYYDEEVARNKINYQMIMLMWMHLLFT